MPSLPTVNWPCHHARSFKGRPRPGLNVNFLPTQWPRNGSNDRDSPHSKSARCSPGSSAQSLKANARIRPTKIFRVQRVKASFIPLLFSQSGIHMLHNAYVRKGDLSQLNHKCLYMKFRTAIKGANTLVLRPLTAHFQITHFFQYFQSTQFERR